MKKQAITKQDIQRDLFALLNIGRYDFFFHNCSDYTNMLLDCADIDGMAGQIASEGNGIISIPSLREINLSLANEID